MPNRLAASSKYGPKYGFCFESWPRIAGTSARPSAIALGLAVPPPLPQNHFTAACPPNTAPQARFPPSSLVLTTLGSNLDFAGYSVIVRLPAFTVCGLPDFPPISFVIQARSGESSNDATISPNSAAGSYETVLKATAKLRT